MNCRAARQRLQDSLDGTPIESADWLEHLRACSDCRELAAAARRLQEGLQLLAVPPPPPNLTARIVQSVRLDRQRRQRRRRQRWAVSLVLAASLFLVLSLRLDWNGRGRVGMPGSSPRSAESAPPAQTPTLRESAAELSDTVAALTRQTADDTMEQTRGLVPKLAPDALASTDWTSFQAPTRTLRPTVEGVSAGLQPVADSARRAVDLFLRELPPM